MLSYITSDTKNKLSIPKVIFRNIIRLNFYPRAKFVLHRSIRIIRYQTKTDKTLNLNGSLINGTRDENSPDFRPCKPYSYIYIYILEKNNARPRHVRAQLRSVDSAKRRDS